MFRIAIQVKELISSNLTHAMDSASNPAKMLGQLQREVEEAIIGLQGELTQAERRLERAKAKFNEAELRGADWTDKAKIAMDNDREDLARSALLAREECKDAAEAKREEIAGLKDDIREMTQAICDLEAKHTETRSRLADQRAADGGSSSAGCSSAASSTDRRMDHISRLEKRTEFATQDSAISRGHAATEREIEEMRRDRKIDEELESLRGDAAKPAKPAARKPRKKTNKAA